MRIGIVCPYSLTLPGGVQGQVLGLARTLRHHGHRVRVLGPCDGPPPDAGVTSLGNSLPTAANGSMVPVAPDASAQLRLLRAIGDEAFDVVHLHEPCAPGATMTAMVMKPAPLVATFHVAADNATYRSLGRVLRHLTKRIDRCFAVSEEARHTAYDAVGGEYTILFNGVDVPHYRDAEPWPTQGPTVFFVGRHEPRKGVDILVAAMADLPGDVSLWVAGDGPQTAALKGATRDDPRVHWLGRISEQEKARRLRAADVFCAPALGGESFGIVLLEAMAAGTPVVASSIAGYRDVARGGLDAALVEPGNPVALAAELKAVLGDADRARRLEASGRERADELSMERLAQIYLDCYASLTGLPADPR